MHSQFNQQLLILVTVTTNQHQEKACIVRTAKTDSLNMHHFLGIHQETGLESNRE